MVVSLRSADTSRHAPLDIRDIPTTATPASTATASTARDLRTALAEAPASLKAHVARDQLAALDDAALAHIAADVDGADVIAGIDAALADAPQALGDVSGERARLAAHLPPADDIAGSPPPSLPGTDPATGVAPAVTRDALLLDLAQLALDIVGIVEPTPFADLANTGLSVARGDWLGAGLSLAGVLPYVGDLAKVGKLPGHVAMVERATDLARIDPAFADQARPALRAIADALDGAPLDALPASVREPLASLRGRVDDVLSGPGRFPAFVDGARHVDPLTGRPVVDARAGTSGDWSATLNGPLEAGTLYRTDTGYLYTTDAQGRVAHVEGQLQLQTGSRNTYQQRVSGRDDRLDTDQGGHLIATVFNGPGEAANLVPQDANLNMGAWKQMENGWAAALRDGDSVAVRVEPVYTGDSLRPEAFAVRYQVNDGRPVTRFFDNQPGG